MTHANDYFGKNFIKNLLFYEEHFTLGLCCVAMRPKSRILAIAITIEKHLKTTKINELSQV